MSGICIQNITKTYGGGNAPVLQELNLTVGDGELFFLLGPSGCGKSTLLRIIAGLLPPDSGQILLGGKDITFLPPEKRNTPMVFQNYALWPHLNVYENIAFGLRVRKMPEREISAKIAGLLAAVRLEDCTGRKIGSLSGGQQRVALARALALDPPLILLDEPLSNLDAKLRDSMRYEIRRICKERGVTALYVTHDRREALSMGDRIAVLEKGILRQTGTPRDVYRNPANRFTAAFLGDANFVTGILESRENSGHLIFRLPFGRWEVEKQIPGEADFVPGREYTLMFRPEDAVVVQAAGEEGLFRGNLFSAELRDCVFLGESSQLHLERKDFSFLVNEYGTGREARIPGSECRIGIRPEDITPLKE